MSHTLLLADASTTTQRVINLTFAETEVDVVACSDGEAALRMLDDSRPDIVLADIELPGLSGYDLVRHMADRPRLAGIPVLLMSGALDPVDDDQTVRFDACAARVALRNRSDRPRDERRGGQADREHRGCAYCCRARIAAIISSPFL